MQGNNYGIMLHIGGTLGGTATREYILPFNATLTHVQVSASANTNSVFKLGSGSDDDAYIASTALGSSGAAVEIGPAGMIGGVAQRFTKGASIVASVTKGDTAAANVSVFLNFTEG